MKVPTKPELWEEMKSKARATSKGSEPGRWSAHKAALAQREYTRRGGNWRSTDVAAKSINETIRGR
jgi:hypothetical protein